MPPPHEGAPTADDLQALKSVSVASLSPLQAVEERNIGERIRWDGAVQRITTTEDGMCLTILYARGGEEGAPRWTDTPTSQSFEACAGAAYDPALVGEFTTVTIIGRISGRTSIGSGGGGKVGPVVQIESLFRWSDCLEGDMSPECKYGFLSPQDEWLD